MIGKFKKYADYKDSYHQWIGEIPSHWNIILLNYLFKENKIKNKGNVENTILSLSYGRVILKKGGENYGLLPASFESYQVLEPGYLVFRFTDLQNDQRSLRVGYVNEKGIITSAYVGLKKRDEEVYSKYYYYLFHSLDIKKYFYSFGGGVRLSLDYNTLKKIKFPFPPLTEQKTIANFLDHKTAQIDRYIQLKEKTIALLQERKAAIINQAVTKGLDPAAPMKDSGIEWLGEIPAHWEVKRIKRLLSKIDYGVSESSKVDGQIPILTMGNIQQGEITEPNPGGLYNVADNLILKKNDLLFTRTNGNPDLVGKVGIYRKSNSNPITFASYLVRFRVDKNADPEWIHLVLNSYSFWSFAKSQALVNLQTNLNSTRYSQFKIPVPNKKEQERMKNVVYENSRKINQLIFQIEKEIILIKEYRESLISAAVTGKIDVQEYDRPAKGVARKTSENEGLEEALAK